jgi:hypothetical protein
MADKVHAALGKTDWKLLAEQKAALVEGAMHRADLLEGLLAFIDAIQDAAEAEGYPVVWLETEE